MTDETSFDRRPALFDHQVNGFAGIDFQRSDMTREMLRTAVQELRKHGIYRIFLTLITDEIEALCGKLERVETFRAEDPLIHETVAGYHIEGPYLSPKPGYRGAHPAEKMKAPDLREFGRLQAAANGGIRILTLAPEWEGSDGFIREVVSRDVAVSLGHTDASHEAIDRAIRAGATLCTHLGNGCPGVLDRHANVIQRLLARDELTACFIPDGIHIPPHALKNLYRAKPKGKTILTSDCMAAAGAPNGRYTLGELEIEVGDDRVVRQPGESNLAGSALTLEEGVMNFSLWLDVPMEEAWALGSTAVADRFGIELPMIAGPAQAIG